MWSVSPKVLFPEIPTIRFEPEGCECSCERKLKVLKTRRKTAVTSEIGRFNVHETIKCCDACDKIYSSGELRKLVPHLCRFGFNVLVHVGKTLFVENRTEKQIQCELENRGIPISIRQIGYLGKKFIVYLALAHKESQERIRELLSSKGGYILHLDGTCEADSPHLMSALDEVAKIVLGNIKIPSEKADNIIPFLLQIKQAYGIPIALVHDMGTGILSAVKKVFPNVADFICHYHFLRDIGKDLLGFEYAMIRNALKKHSIRSLLRKIAGALKEEIETNPELTKSLYSYLQFQGKATQQSFPAVLAYILVHWILDANSESNGYGFPFDRPHHVFYQRLHSVKAAIKIFPAKMKKDRCIAQLDRSLGRVLNDRDLKKIVSRMEEKANIFDQLREAMRIAVSEGKKGLNDDGDDTDIKTIKEKVTSFRNSEKIKAAALKDIDYKKMVKQIDKYWEKLFADPIMITTSKGEQISIQPQRTNNILERFFRDLKRMYRKKGGNKTLNRTLKAIIADTPLVKNLLNQEYMKILLNGKDTLEERFAEIDAKLVQQELKGIEAKQNKISQRMKKLLRISNLPVTVAKMSKAAAAL